ncbi:hypothetical protein [Bacteroides caecigallinarum]|uniref:hypothetical protein n=1 Tax=Bacteroides caecigallinarum TaxID=1411144 RepID=UPI001F1E7196|nr:hypothetical protein [Bacteroides caecigallinarum]MCF2738235.1 hypothetical protein [Bacteroides caecigallinarum]
MRAFIYIFLTFIGCSVFLGCKTGKHFTSTDSHTQIIVHDKLIPVFRASDSASIRALLECDSNGRVLLSWFDMAQSENAKLKFQLDSMGNLLADFKVPSDTVYIQGKDSTIIKAEVKHIEVERKRNSWEKFCIGFTIIALLSIIAFVILKLRSIIKF